LLSNRPIRNRSGRVVDRFSAPVLDILFCFFAYLHLFSVRQKDKDVMAKPWEIDLSEYVGLAAIDTAGICRFGDSVAQLEDLDGIIKGKDFIRIRPDGHGEYYYLLTGCGHIGAYHAETDRIVGGGLTQYPYVKRQHRGRNIGAMMNVILDNHGHRTPASIYSSEGFAARVSAHRLHVEQALRRGDTVPREVSEQYCAAGNGRLKLRKPYTAEDHNAWCAQRRLEIRSEQIEKQSQGYLETFRRPEDTRTDDFENFSPYYGGYLLSIALHRATGAGFLLHQNPDHEDPFSLFPSSCLPEFTIQSELDGMVIDADGVRPAGLALMDLRQRDLVANAPVKTLRFDTEEEILDWLRPAEKGSPGQHLPGMSEQAIRDALESRPGRRMMRSAHLQSYMRHNEPEPDMDYGF
jgi:hypothetical protein